VTPDMQLLWETHYDGHDLSYTDAIPIYEASPSFTLSVSVPQAFGSC
jgi:hypothetical protein